MVEVVYLDYSDHPYVRRQNSPYLEIAADETSNEFHPSQVLAMATGYAIPPYNLAGFTDIFLHISHGETRSTHLATDFSVVGFVFSVAIPYTARKEAIQARFSEYIPFGEEIKRIVDDKDTSDAAVVQKIEDKYGKTIVVPPESLVEPLEGCAEFLQKKVDQSSHVGESEYVM